MEGQINLDDSLEEEINFRKDEFEKDKIVEDRKKKGKR